MTIVDAGNGIYIGLSGDAKATTGLAAGSQFYETDTNRWYFWDGARWLRKIPFLPSYGRIVGTRNGLGGNIAPATAGAGLLNQVTLGTGGTHAGGTTTTDGNRLNSITNATANNRAGYSTTTFTWLGANPRVKIRFRLQQANSVNNRLYIGFCDTVQPATGVAMGDTWLDGKNGVLLGYRTTDAGWTIINNNAAATATYTSAGLAAIDTSAHTIEMWGDSANSRFQWAFDGGTVNNISAGIPSSTTLLAFFFILETGTTTSYGVYERWTEFEMDGL